MRAGVRFTQALDPAEPEVSGGLEEEAVVVVAEVIIPVVAVGFREAEVTVAVAVRAAVGDPTGESA